MSLKYFRHHRWKVSSDGLIFRGGFHNAAGLANSGFRMKSFRLRMKVHVNYREKFNACSWHSEFTKLRWRLIRRDSRRKRDVSSSTWNWNKDRTVIDSKENDTNAIFILFQRNRSLVYVFTTQRRAYESGPNWFWIIVTMAIFCVDGDYLYRPLINVSVSCSFDPHW